MLFLPPLQDSILFHQLVININVTILQQLMKIGICPVLCGHPLYY